MRAFSGLRSGRGAAVAPQGSLGSLAAALMVGRRRSPSVEVVGSSLSRRHISRKLKQTTAAVSASQTLPSPAKHRQRVTASRDRLDRHARRDRRDRLR